MTQVTLARKLAFGAVLSIGASCAQAQLLSLGLGVGGPVKVELANTSANPLQVSGKVVVTGSPAVTINDSVPVKVSVNQPVQRPYQETIGASAPCGNSCGLFVFPEVPVRHRLVLTYVSAALRSQTPGVSVSVMFGQGFSHLDVPVPYPNARFLAAPIMLNADPGTAPTVRIVQLLGENAPTLEQQRVTLVGYLVPIEQAP